MKKSLLKNPIASITKLCYFPMQKGFCSLLILFLTGMQLHAQITIKGTVSNAHKEPVSNVNILLYTSSDSLLIKAASTDANGRFALSPIPKGSYHLSASSIGYDKMQISIDNIEQDIHSLQIVLNEKIEKIEEIAVSANKKYITLE